MKDPTNPIRQRRWAAPPEVARYIGTTVSTLATWRCNEPARLPWHRLGRLIRYDLNEIDATVAGGEG